ncbi:MAG: hypothetical protein QNJ55_30655 [Xenococcus sp. MO_188.B8]|nr:hypothetical protein [Xenococcus sp. MO_188.B8]
MTSIDSRIGQIIAKRRPTAENIEKVKSNLGSLYTSLNNLENKKKELQDQSTEQDPNLASKLDNLNFSRLQVLIINQLQVLNQMQVRFSRETLNLAVVANAKQGKSRLLRSLTGLSEDVIPDGNKGHCTGVASTIYPNHDGNETYALIWFHTPESFLMEIIAPYYKKLQLGAAPKTISDFKKPLPSLPPELAQNTNNIYKEMYYYLDKYHKYLNQYESSLGTTTLSKPLKTTTDSEIRKYVAQYDPQGNSTYDYMAVKKCDIFCPFPNAPTDKIAVLDTQGLGDTGVGDKERLIEVIGKSVDIILFMKMPHPTSASWGTSEIELYSVANTALANHLPLEKWSFFILNQTDNLKDRSYLQCELLKSQVPNTIKVIGDLIIANCADEVQARDIILNPVVDYLIEHIETLDREYSDSYQQELNQLQLQINEELEKASNMLITQTENQEAWIHKSNNLFNKSWWREFTGGFNKIYKEITQKNNERDFKNQVHFKNQVNEAVKKAKSNSGLPLDDPNGMTAFQKIEEEITTDETGERDGIYNKYLNKARTNLTRSFYSLDDGLNEAINEVKIKIANLFVDKLGFDNLTDKRGVEFIQAMSESIQNDQIKKAFQVLSEYRLSFKGLILPRIRPLLKDLESRGDKKIFIRVGQAANRTETEAQQIFHNVETLYEETLNKCKDELKNMLGEPVQAALAILEEFEELAIRDPEIKDEWWSYIIENRAKIWVDEFGERNSSAYQAEWQNLLQQAKEYSSSNNFQIFN